jgi:hypothetical protein
MLIAEELVLLALDDVTGKKKIGSDKLEPAVGGALVTELALLERIGITPREDGWSRRGRITITSLKPTDDPDLDLMLERLAANEGKKLKDLLSTMGFRKRVTKDFPSRLLERLARAGILTPHRDKVLGLIPRTTWPAPDPSSEDEVRQRLQSALVAGLTPTERTVALIALLQAVGLLDKVVKTDDRKLARSRAKELSEGDWAAKAVRDAIQEAAAASASAIAAGGAG